jgi:diacylglycerol kinase (ATP)
MTELVKVVLNPYAGRGRGGQAAARICEGLALAGIPFDLARKARLEGFTTVIAAGGDGTVSEVVNGLAQATPADQPVGNLGLLPVGSANDFADMPGCSRDLQHAARVIAAGRTRRIDLGYTTVYTGAATL